METMSEQIQGTVLVVDDDEGVRKVLTRWVSDMGYVVKAAADADTALQIVQESAIDIALCDIRMPGHDGIWLIEQIGRLHCATAIVLATGLMEMDPAVTLRPGVAGYVVKPFNREDLAKVVKRGMAEHKRMEAEGRPQPRLLPDTFLDGVIVSRSEKKGPSCGTAL
jgi:DNA-binding NtrC family response regulator